MERRIAEAKIMLLTTDHKLITALDHLATIGKQSYRAARDQTVEYPSLIDRHREALLQFAAASQQAPPEKVI